MEIFKLKQLIKEETYDFLGLDIGENDGNYNSEEFKIKFFNDVIKNLTNPSVFDNVDIVMSKDEISMDNENNLKLEYDGTFTYKTDTGDIPVNIHIEDRGSPDEDPSNINFNDFNYYYFTKSTFTPSKI